MIHDSLVEEAVNGEVISSRFYNLILCKKTIILEEIGMGNQPMNKKYSTLDIGFAYISIESSNS